MDGPKRVKAESVSIISLVKTLFQRLLLKISSLAYAEDVANYALQINKTGDGSGTVVSEDNAIACGAQCVASYTPKSSVFLKAVPASASSFFAGWTGPCESIVQNFCLVFMDSAKAVTAHFSLDPAKILFPLSVTLDGIGVVTSNPPGIDCGSIQPTGSVCVKEFPIGRTVTLTAVPRLGSTAVFSRWSGNCSIIKNNTCTLITDSSKSVTATFVYPPLQSAYPLQVRIEGQGSVVSEDKEILCGTSETTGQMACSRGYIYGSSVFLKAVPADSFTFMEWSGGCISTVQHTCLVYIDAAKNVTAKFKEQPQLFQLSVVPVGGGTVQTATLEIECGSDCAEQYLKKTIVSLSANPSQGSVFNGWGGACSGKGLCTVTMDAKKFVYAFFGASSPTLTVLKNGSGTVESSPSGISCGSVCSSSFPAGTSVSLTAIPAAGHQFAGWGGYGGCAGKNPTCAFSLRMRKQVVANFK
ncbi:MAG: hypothetical protein HYV78_02405 [Candidatus Wildermuthbacteria bacterium]|nr:hypothetical protein [Candidatus Wildermuthbacteria bacterium]